MLPAMEVLSTEAGKPDGFWNRIRGAVLFRSNRVAPIRFAPAPPTTAFEGPPMVSQDPVLAGAGVTGKGSEVRAGNNVAPLDTARVGAQPSVDGGKTLTNPVIGTDPITGRAFSSESASSATVVVEEQEEAVEAELDAAGSCAALVEEPSTGEPPVVRAEMGTPAGAGGPRVITRRDRSASVAGLDFAKLQAQQVLDDARNFDHRPVLIQAFENIPPPVCRRQLGAFIASGNYSTVFALTSSRGMNPLVIKYQGDCETGSDGRHPLLMDYWYTRAASQHGLSPTPLFISPSERMIGYCDTTSHCMGPAASKDLLETDGILNKLQFKVFNNAASIEARQCMALGEVRYMVTERVGECLDSRLTNPVSPPGAVGVGIRVIGMLEELHEKAGIIHRNIHTGNICSILGGDPLNDLVFIDFEYATAVSNEGECCGEIECSRRGDVVRVLFIVAALMFENLLGVDLTSTCTPTESAETIPDEVLEACEYLWNEEGSNFNGIESNTQFTETQKEAIHRAVIGVRKIVTKIVDGTDEIPYRDIIIGLEEVRAGMAGVTFEQTVPSRIRD